MTSQPGAGGGNIGVRQARAEAITDSSGSQNLLRRPLTWVWSMPASRQELLVRDEATCRALASGPASPTRCVMAVNDELRVCAQGLHRRQPDRIHADHQAGASVSDKVVVAAEHLIDVASEIGGVHHALSCLLVVHGG